jgi:hypothetical protein
VNSFKKRTARIANNLSRSVRERKNVPLLLLAAVLTVVFGRILITRKMIEPGSTLDEMFLGFAIEMGGAVIVFLILEQGIERIRRLSIFEVGEQPELPVAKFIEDVRKASDQVRILDTWTCLINEDEYRKDFEPALKEAIRNGAKVEILLIEPDSEGARQRAAELEDSGIDVIEEIRRCLRRFGRLQQEVEEEITNSGDGQKHLEIKLYNASPSIYLHWCDDQTYWSFFSVNKRADKTPQLEVPISAHLGRYLAHRFDELWEDDDTRPLDQYLQSVRNGA